MDYKGYNIAVHELGHNVEQVFSLTTIDHTLLQGVPNTAFTEALAFVFQARDLALLGLAGDRRRPRRGCACSTSSGTRARSPAWRSSTSAPGTGSTRTRTRRRPQFREAVVAIAQEVWNQHYAPLFGQRDVALLGIYSHMVDYAPLPARLPARPPDRVPGRGALPKVGGPMGTEFERVARSAR